MLHQYFPSTTRATFSAKRSWENLILKQLIQKTTMNSNRTLAAIKLNSSQKWNKALPNIIQSHNFKQYDQKLIHLSLSCPKKIWTGHWKEIESHNNAKWKNNLFFSSVILLISRARKSTKLVTVESGSKINLTMKQSFSLQTQTVLSF